MAAEFPELERGEAAAVTKRKHVPTWLYKQSHRLTGEMAEIRAELEKIGPFNAGRQREKILELLGQWYPRVNAFEAKLKPYDQQIRQIAAEKAALTRQTETAVYALDRKRQEEEESRPAEEKAAKPSSSLWAVMSSATAFRLAKSLISSREWPAFSSSSVLTMMPKAS